MKRRKTVLFAVRFFLTAVIPLAVGWVFYYVFNGDFTVSRLAPPFIKGLCLPEKLAWMRNSRPCILFRNYGCDACWAFSLESVLLSIAGAKIKNAVITAGICTAVGASVEAMQLFGIFPGTFDAADIIVQAAASAAGAAVPLLFGKTENGG